jgi:hypothetical protein
MVAFTRRIIKENFLPGDRTAMETVLIEMLLNNFK